MASTVNELFSGHLRSILGGLTMEEIIRDRARLAAETRNSSAEEMETLGLKIDSLQIQEVDDPSGYIQNLAAPHQAAVERAARIAAAEAKAREVKLDAGANAKRVEIEAAANAKRVEIEATAQARATEQTGLAKAAATRATGEAEAAATAAKLTAEANGIEKRAAALEKNNEAVIAQTLAENAPELVRAAAESFRGIDNL